MAGSQVQVVYIGGSRANRSADPDALGDVEIAATGQWATFGEPVDVDADVAGRAPKGDDPGEGLLAQPDNWAKPTTKAAKAALSEESS